MSPNFAGMKALRRAWRCGAAFPVFVWLIITAHPAMAQAIWQGADTNYNTAGNWSTNNVPDAGGESASFQNTGSTTILVNSAVAPDSWSFASNSQAYTTSGSAVTLSTGLTSSASANISIGNAIGGTGTLTQSGTGTLILAGANGYSGTTTINSGTLQIGNGDTSGTPGSGAIINNGTLTYNRTDTLVVANNISGSGGLAVSAGIMTLTGTNTFTGTTTIAAGSILKIGNIGTTGTLASSSVVDNGVLSIARSDDTTFAGVITGSGSLVKAVSGKLTLTGNNSYTGGTSVIGTASLQVGNGGTTGSLGSGTVTTSGPVIFNRSDTVTVSDKITNDFNAGSVVQAGSGTLVLSSNTSNYSGGTTVSAGTLRLAANNAAGSGAITSTGVSVIDYADGVTIANNIVIASNTTKLQVSAGSATLSGVISETGGARPVEKTGAGTLILIGANTYSGVTTITAGTLQVSNDNTIGTLGSGTVTDNGALVFNRSNAVTLAVVVSGTGSLRQAGYGNLTISAAQTYTGATTIEASKTLALSGAGDLSASSGVAVAGTFDISAITPASTTIKALTGAGTVALGAKQLIVSAGTGSFSGNFTGTSSVELSGGTTTFTGTNSTGFTVDSGATLQIGNGGTAGTVTGTIVDNGTVSFAHSDTITLPAISGTGTLTQAGPGTLVISGTLGLTGGKSIVVSGGTLQIGAGGPSGSINDAAIVNNGTVAFNRSDTITVNSAISGSGGLIQNGGGNLNYTGTGTYTGATLVNAGTLSVNGSIASSAVTVNNGGKLGGNGTTGAVTVASGGTIAPGNSIGTLNVASLTLAAGSTYTVELSPTAADRINVTGAASLNGTLALAPAAGTYAATTYRLIQAGSLTGTFSSVTGSVTGFTNTVQYSATAVDLILSVPATPGAPSTSPPPSAPPAPSGPAAPLSVTYLFASYGSTPNQIAAGNGLTAGSNTGALYLAMGSLVGSNVNAVAPTLGLLAGDIRPSLRAAAIEDSSAVRNILLDHMEQGAEGTVVWGAGFAGYGSFRGDGNAAGLHHENGGFLAGVDFAAMPDLRIGVVGGYSTNNARTTSRLSTASGDQGHVGGYAAFDANQLAFRLGGDYGFGSVNVTRAVSGLGQNNAGSQDQQTGQIFGDVGYRILVEGASLQPHITVAHIITTGGAFSETGSISALSGAGKSDSLTYAILGLRAALTDIKLSGDYDLIPRIDMGWQHALSHLTPGQSVTYQDSGTSFTVLGTPLAADAAAVQAGIELKAGALSVFLAYDGAMAASSDSHGFRGGLDWRF